MIQAPAFPHVFTPIQIGGVTLRNRLYMSAHTTFSQTDPSGYGRWTALGERSAYYYAERAKGGFALLVAGALQVHPQGGSYRPGAYTPEARAFFEQISAGVHEHGARIFAQLNQHGRLKGGSGSDDWDPMWAPSVLPPVYHGLPHKVSGEMARAMTKEDIDDLVLWYGRSAYNAREGGMDGVEVHIGHTHLFSEWLMPAFNQRTDEYGGSLDNRMRFIVEALREIRRQTGEGFPIGVRMNLEWPMPGGLTLTDTAELAMKLEATGALDYISCTIFPGEKSMPTNRLAPGFQIPKAAVIKQAVSIPVLALGRIVDPAEAEKILADELVDMVGMTKAGIADPELPRKVMEGRLDDIRPCVGGQQGCFARIIADKPLSCTQNPAVGLEKDWGAGTIVPAATARRVLVAGGGPAGMEAAMIARMRGHDVTLYEKSDSLGGQIKLLGRIPFRDEFLGVVNWRRRQVEKLGVKVVLNTEVTPEMVLAENPDVVIVATGSTQRLHGWYPDTPGEPTIPGLDTARVFTATDVLEGRADDVRTLAVIDSIGYHQSADPFEYLANRGATVHGITSSFLFANDVLLVDRTLWLQGLRGKDVYFHHNTSVRAVRGTSLDLVDTMLGRTSTLEGIEAIVMSVGADVDDSLYQALKGRVDDLHVIGDAWAPRRIEQAIHEGHKLGREI
jgi:2,4-dienoyl-CoA reductase-like NADH-dependent reductase (Old Yellow Enzyme family)/thioredoxin reductase